jgi:hypothetical protein
MRVGNRSVTSAMPSRARQSSVLPSWPIHAVAVSSEWSGTTRRSTGTGIDVSVPVGLPIALSLIGCDTSVDAVSIRSVQQPVTNAT